VGSLTLVDGQRGSTSFTDGQWLGFLGTDLVATIDLKKATAIRTVESHFLQDTGSGILLPTKVEIAVSKDGQKFRTVYAAPVAAATPAKPSISAVTAELKKTKARFVRITAQNAQPAPATPSAQKARAWLFVDEVVVQ
jgi:hexosaminidase